jgi:hypothetical protein
MALLKARGAFIDLPTACHTGDLERVRELLREDPSLANRVGEHEGGYLGSGAPLWNAAAVGRLDIVELLLDHGADPNLPEEQIAPKGRALYAAVSRTLRDREAAPRARRVSESAGRKLGRRALGVAGISPRHTDGAVAACLRRHADHRTRR